MSDPAFQIAVSIPRWWTLTDGLFRVNEHGRLSLIRGAVFLYSLYWRLQIKYAAVLELHSDSILGIRDSGDLAFAADALRRNTVPQAVNSYNAA